MHNAFTTFLLFFLTLIQINLNAAPKPREPNWRYQIIEYYDDGLPLEAIYYEPLPGSDQKKL